MIKLFSYEEMRKIDAIRKLKRLGIRVNLYLDIRARYSDEELLSTFRTHFTGEEFEILQEYIKNKK